MKVRFKFTKTGRLRYIGHLDLLDVWGRALKASGLPVGYSKGYSPHMLVSFAAPLPLGLESVSEYVDVDFDDGMPLGGLADRLNARFPAGLEILGVYAPESPYKRVASIVTAAEYLMELPFAVTEQQIDSFMAQETVEVMKKTKRSDGIADIRADILSFRKVGETEISVLLSCGSARNLKPTLFLEAFGRFAGQDIHKTKIMRTEIFVDNENSPLSKC